MSLIWRPPRNCFFFLILFLCIFQTFSVNAEQSADAVSWTEDTEITAELVGDVVLESVGDAEDTVSQMPDAAEIFRLMLEENNAAAVESSTDEAQPVVVAETSDSQAESDYSVETAQSVETSRSAEEKEATEMSVASEVLDETAQSVEAQATEMSVAAEVVDETEMSEFVPQPETPLAQAIEEADVDTAIAATDVVAEKVDEEKVKSYFRRERWNVLVIIAALLCFISYFTFQAQRGKELFVRRISGLSALDEAVGRATEMGRGVLYIPGIRDMDDIQTIAGITIMGHVAKKTAEYDTPFYAPMSRSFVMSVAQEVVKQSYLEKGRADAFRPDRINYLTDDQFGFTAGVSGLMMREKPAACFFLGTFFAESLILAETGNKVGAIQVAGTAEPSQIPFFVAACDYTLIGEELFAASAYLSQNPKEIGSLKGQDVSKAIIIGIIIIGTILMSISTTEFGSQTIFHSATKAYMQLFD